MRGVLRRYGLRRIRGVKLWSIFAYEAILPEEIQSFGLDIIYCKRKRV